MVKAVTVVVLTWSEHTLTLGDCGHPVMAHSAVEVGVGAGVDTLIQMPVRTSD